MRLLMKSMFLRTGAVIAASLLATAALSAQQTPAEAPENAAPANQVAEKPETAEAPAETGAEAEPERICRYVKLDTASRRKTKICRTTDEWRDLGNPR
jgi:hypothetical protein